MTTTDTQQEQHRAPSRGTGRTIAGVILLVFAIVGGLIGFAWLVVFYATQGSLPISALGSWNLIVGGFFFVAGIPMLILAIWLLVSGSRKRRVS